ncbi:MAG TPA: response regulator transcription factor [Puia sp.]|jgi:DNA-binding response OmpR family regulator|nr:response regulator transcription factor [Puia sp.]
MSKIKVLYVEDEIFLGKIVKETLESRGFEVLMETNGARVLTVFENGRPDICVLDIMLPNVNGFELAEAIRARNDDIPIIFLTAKTQTEDLVRGFRIGGNDYIRKPFSMEELIVRIENCLRVQKEPPVTAVPEILPIGEFVFYLNRQVLAGGGEERKLSYRESELLRQLWMHKDKVIEREDILQAIWGNDSFLNSRNLDVYITKLRSYLKADERVEILTIKGVGYRFVLP